MPGSGFDTAETVSVVLDTAGRDGARRAASSGTLGLGRRVHGGGEPLAPRVSAPSATVAAVVARRRRNDAGARAHGRRLPVRAARTGAHRRVLLRDQPLARLVAAVRVADRSQHTVVDGARAGADRDVAAGGLHGGVRVPRDSTRAGGVARRALRPAAAVHRHRGRAAGGRSSPARTPTIRGCRPIRGWSSCSCRRSCGR